MTPRGAGTQPAPPSGGSSRLRALAGPALAVGGVLLGIGSLLIVTDDPSQRLGPVVRAEPTPAVPSEPPRPTPAPTDPAVPAPPAPVPSPAAPTPVPPPPTAAPTSRGPAPAAAGPAERRPAPRTTGSATPRRSLVVPVTVLNNSNRPGLAERAAARFDRGGWPVALTGNFRGKIPVTTVYYDPGMEASARAFAASFQGIVRVRPRFATLPARGVVVVLTREFAA